MMENQLEKKTENVMQTTLRVGVSPNWGPAGTLSTLNPKNLKSETLNLEPQNLKECEDDTGSCEDDTGSWDSCVLEASLKTDCSLCRPTWVIP